MSNTSGNDEAGTNDLNIKVEGVQLIPGMETNFPSSFLLEINIQSDKASHSQPFTGLTWPAINIQSASAL